MLSKVLTGAKFNETHKNAKLIKLTHEKEIYSGMTFKTGLNTFNKKFDPENTSILYPLNFTVVDKLTMWFGKNLKYARIVTIPDDAKVFFDRFYFVADKIILGERILISDLEELQDEAFCLNCIKKNGMILEHIKKQTLEMCVEAVTENGLALEHVIKQSPNLCEIAVQQNCDAIQFVEKKTDALMLLAIKTDAHVVKYLLKNLTDKLRIEALRENGYVLQYFEEQDVTMCSEAVKSEGNALEFVKIQTKELCQVAYRQDKASSHFMKEEYKHLFIK